MLQASYSIHCFSFGFPRLKWHILLIMIYMHTMYVKTFIFKRITHWDMNPIFVPQSVKTKNLDKNLLKIKFGMVRCRFSTYCNHDFFSRIGTFKDRI